MPIVSKAREETKTSMYAEVDSDNESDFDTKYERIQDSYDDLKQISKPVFLSDLIQGIQSEDIRRFTLCMESAEALIRTQNSNDLEIQVSEFLQVIFRTDNKFDNDDFMVQKYASIQAVIEL